MKNDFQPIKSDMKQERDKLCYLTIGDKDEKWGVVVTTIGYQFIPPGTKYPLSAHPDNYSFMPPRRTDTERIPVGLYHQGFRVFRFAVLSRGACEGRDGDLVVSRGVA